MPLQEKKKVFIVVRTYPTPAGKGAEVSCTAAIMEDRKWIRLFPIPYRFMDIDKRFVKYQWIEAFVTKARDARPESYNIDVDSIRILGGPISPEHEWRERKEILFPLRSHCLCCLKRMRDKQKSPTLGLFRPKAIERLVMEPETGEWSADQLAILQQKNLLEKGPRALLEKVPFSFKYRFRCDDDNCPGHELSCTDWEMGQSWRRWRDQYGDSWEAKFRQRYETEMIERNDTHFFVGTVHKHPHIWIIVGLFYPPRLRQPDFFSPSI